MALPMPRPPPVTMATFPLKSNFVSTKTSYILFATENTEMIRN
jgi:hypothetical protein